jgi:ribosome-binding protein aMBF1 (putative translation factor)
MNPTSRDEQERSSRTRPAASERFSEDELAEIRRAFARRLKDAFDHASNAEIARKLKTTDNTIKYYTDADRLPAPEMLLQIARVTGINLHWLLTGNGERRVARHNLFTEDEEAGIRELAREAGRSFENEVRILAIAAAELIRTAK